MTAPHVCSDACFGAERAFVYCPGCGTAIIDFEGVGQVQFHKGCGYCSHPTIIGGACTACGKEPE